MNQNFGLPYPIYPTYQGMPNMNTMPNPMILNNDCSNGDMSGVEKRLDNLEKRVSTLENYINNSMNNTYNSSNYQML